MASNYSIEDLIFLGCLKFCYHSAHLRGTFFKQLTDKMKTMVQFKGVRQTLSEMASCQSLTSGELNYFGQV